MLTDSIEVAQSDSGANCHAMSRLTNGVFRFEGVAVSPTESRANAAHLLEEVEVALNQLHLVRPSGISGTARSGRLFSRSDDNWIRCSSFEVSPSTSLEERQTGHQALLALQGSLERRVVSQEPVKLAKILEMPARATPSA